MDVFHQYLIREGILPQKELSDILKHFGRREFKKGEFLLTEGNTLGYIAFVEKGCQVCIKHLPGGKNQVMDLHFEGDFISILEAEYQRDLSIEFLEDSVLRTITKAGLQDVCKNFPSVTLYMVHKYQWYLSQATARWMDVSGLSAEDRLKKMLNEHPDYFHRIPQYHIASFMGITPQSLSRLRKKIIENKF